ncbi:hypothetical protein Tco_0030277, partial [Tanacetum coccineum]
LLEQAPGSLEYVPDPIELEDHVPVYIPEPKHPEDLVPAEDEAPTPPLPPFFLSLRIRPPRTRAPMAQMRATTPSTYHPLLLSGTPPLLPKPLAIELIFPRLTCRLRRGYYLLLLDLVVRFRDTEKRMMTALEMVNMRKDRAAVRAEIEVLRRERLAYEQESMETRQALARSEAYSMALEAWITALEAGARMDTLEDTGSSS